MIWQARRAKRPDVKRDYWGPRLLCGRMVGGEYVCPETVAWYNERVPPVDVKTPGTTRVRDPGPATGPGVRYWSRCL